MDCYLALVLIFEITSPFRLPAWESTEQITRSIPTKESFDFYKYILSGYDDRNYENSGRRMYSMNDFQMTEEDYNARL